MKMGKYGLSGYLAPNGDWHPCDYKGHGELAKELYEKYGLDETDYNNLAMGGEFIKFGTVPWTEKEGNSMCHAFLNRLHEPTKQQLDWLNQNLNKATDKQINEVLMIFSLYYKAKLDLLPYEGG